jgi:hypothetical protein
LGKIIDRRNGGGDREGPGKVVWENRVVTLKMVSQKVWKMNNQKNNILKLLKYFFSDSRK